MNDKANRPETRPHVVPYMCIKGVRDAIEFYRDVFNAEVAMEPIVDGEGRVGHAEIRIGETLLMMADEHPEIDVVSADTYGGSPVSLVVYVPDVDATFAAALAAGAKELRPVQDRFYGARSGVIADPFGYRWDIQTVTEELTVEEIQERAVREQ